MLAVTRVGNRARGGPAMTKIPVFISFDRRHDDDLRLKLLDESAKGDCSFSIAGWSSNEWSSEGGIETIRGRIRTAQQVVVICGLHMGTAAAVSAEIEIAREEQTPYFLLAGRAGMNGMPSAALMDWMYAWDAASLARLVAGEHATFHGGPQQSERGGR